MPFFRVSFSLPWLPEPTFPHTIGSGTQGMFSPIFSRTGYQKKANFLELAVKTCQKRKFCYNGLLFSQIFVFLSILFADFF